MALSIKLILVALIWGAAFVAVKIACVLPPGVASLGRYAVACVALAYAAWRLEGGLPRLNKAQVFGTALLGVFGVSAYNMLIFGAMKHIDASRASLVIALSPALIAAFSAWLLRERLGWLKSFGVLLALAGAWWVICRGEPTRFRLHVGLGEGLMLGAVGCWVAYTLLSRRVLRGLSPLGATAWASLWGTLMLLPVALYEWPQMGAESHALAPWAALALMGILSTAVAFVWYSDGIRHWGASRAGIFTNLVPVFGVLFGVLLLGENPDASLLAGGAMTLAGVGLVNGLGQKFVLKRVAPALAIMPPE